MITYKQLNLTKIRKEYNLDFARDTYSRGQCSCCYGPFDMPLKYWRNDKKPSKIYDDNGAFEYDTPSGDITFILFKNADNGRGHLKSKNELIKDGTCVEYHFESDEQKNKVCAMLQEQLGDSYYLEIPETEMRCIVIRCKKVDI